MADNYYVQLNNLGCRFYLRNGLRRPQAVNALSDISFRFDKGEKLGIIGSNGAGKSTLLHIMAKTLNPNYGKIYFHNQPRISLMTLTPGFSPNNSGRENAILSCIMLGLTRKQALQRLPQITDFAELGIWMNNPLRTYSSGMRTRLGLAITLSVAPDILLVDETLSIGDQQLKRKSQEAINSHIQGANTTVVVSHNLDIINDMCTRVIWLHHGRIMGDGPCAVILDKYKQWCE